MGAAPSTGSEPSGGGAFVVLSLQRFSQPSLFMWEVGINRQLQGLLQVTGRPLPLVFRQTDGPEQGGERSLTGVSPYT